MRFELFLTELPKAPAYKVEAELAEMPKGASVRTILKAMETRNLPTVPVAWSEDKRVLNEVMDTLVELGGGCKLVDHGSIVQKLATWSAEKLGRARYREDEDEGLRTYIKLGSGRENESWQEALTRHALTYLLQLLLVAVLFVWFVALRVGFARVFAVPELIPQLAACAVGLLAAYASSASVRAIQLGRIELKRALPQLIAGGCLTVASLFFLGDGFEQAAVLDNTVKRPPSLPFAGLLTELRRRKLAEELGGEADDQAGRELTEQSEQAEQELWCDADGPLPEELQCRGGALWEEALACLAEPAPPARPVVSKPSRKRPTARPAPVLTRVAAPVARAPERPWSLTLDVSTMVALICMWLLSLRLLVLLRRERAPTPVPAEDAGSPVTPAALIEAQLTALRGERDALRTQLVEANEALASAQLAAAPAPRTPEEAQAANLQRELELTRSTLGANQAAFAQLKQQAANAQSNLSAELERLKQELASTREERDLARSALLDMGGRGLEVSHEPRAAEPGKAARAPTNTNADESAYSVHRVQEERVVLQKRRR